MDRGVSGYSIPDFPSHTPTNSASLLTGTHPTVHGVADGPMHTEGAPLVKPSVGGFSSVAKKISPVWKLLEEAGLSVALLSMPVRALSAVCDSPSRLITSTNCRPS